MPFGSYLLNSTADSAQFKWKWAGLAVLVSRYLPNAPTIFFKISGYVFIKNPQTTIALKFLTHIISDIDGVYITNLKCQQKIVFSFQFLVFRLFNKHNSFHLHLSKHPWFLPGQKIALNSCPHPLNIGRSI